MSDRHTCEDCPSYEGENRLHFVGYVPWPYCVEFDSEDAPWHRSFNESFRAGPRVDGTTDLSAFWTPGLDQFWDSEFALDEDGGVVHRAATDDSVSQSTDDIRTLGDLIPLARQKLKRGEVSRRLT